MQAVVCTDFGASEVRDVPRPTPGSEEVLIRVDRVQLSVTECQMYQGEPLASIELIRDRIQNGDGRVFGHEFCGTVAETGEGVTAFAPGDRVYAPAKIACHACAYCEAGYTQQCTDKETIGTNRPGALAEYLCLPAEPLAHLPDRVTDAEGAAMQPLASAVLCVHDAGITTGDVVAVIGCGVMGYQCAQLAGHQGAREVIAVDVVPEKLEIAADNGITPVNPRETDPVDVVHDLTDGIGADVVFPAVGGRQDHLTHGTPMAQAFDLVRAAGTVLQVGLLIGEAGIEPRALRKKSVRWVNPRFGVTSTGPNTDTGVLAPRLVADGRVSIEEYITHELIGLDSFEEAVAITLEKEDSGALGPPQIVVNPDAP